MRAHEKFASETNLASRIQSLADAVAPVADTVATAFSLSAQAHFRERLHQSSAAAQTRVQSAEMFVNRATEATRSAKRDQSAIEKLLDRARIADAVKEMRALEEAPPSSPLKAKRHDPC